MRKEPKLEAIILRQKAEELMKTGSLNTVSQLSESNSLKLIHELKVHQIELEIQKEELELVKNETNVAIQKYIELYDFAPSGYFTLSKSGKIIELNLSGANMLGKERSHLKNTRFDFSISTNTRPIFNLFLAQVFNSKSRETCEVTLLTHDNLSMYVQLTGITAENGEYCFMTAIDITERKQAEETLHKSQAKLDEAIKMAQLGTWEHDIDRHQFKFNDQFYTLLHTTAEREGGYVMTPTHYAQKFLHPDDKALVGAESQKTLDTTDPNYHARFDHRLICIDGEIIHITVNIRIVKDSHGRTVKTYGVNQDITQRKRMELEIIHKSEELQKLNTEKDKFFSIIAHDLRGPFSGFLGLTQIMADQLSSFTMTEIQDLAASMKESATNLYRLLENLLQWSKMQQGLIRFDLREIQLHPVVYESITMVQDIAKNKGIEITTDIPDDIVVYADSNILQTILRNIVSNAVKFTPKGGKISLSGRILLDESVEIAVKDTGIGMNPEMVANLFELNKQTGRKGTEGEPSTGLGLLLCKEFIEKLDGKLWVKSEEGKGSEFKFTIPMKYNI